MPTNRTGTHDHEEPHIEPESDVETFHCHSCDEDREVDNTSQCGECEQCEDCCDCIFCENCQEDHVNDTDFCDECHSCTDSCVCVRCPLCGSECSDRMCRDCLQCEECCECIYCESCSENHPSGTDFCPECHSCVDSCSCSNEDSGLHPYNADPLKIVDYFRNYPQHRRRPGIMGFELEMNCREDDSLAEEVESLLEVANQGRHPWAVMKEDGSLSESRGAEFVSCPMPLQELEDAVAPMQNQLRRWKGWGIRGYGVHVSYSRTGLSELQEAKILTVWNSKNFRQAIIALSGRDEANLNRWARFGNPDESFYSRKKMGEHATQKYKAVNMKHSTHMEFRVFQSTTKVERLFCYFELVHAIVQWAKSQSIVDLHDLGLFTEFIQKHKKTYKHLLEYWEKLISPDSTFEPKSESVDTMVTVQRPQNVNEVLRSLYWNSLVRDGVSAPSEPITVEEEFHTYSIHSSADIP